MEINSNTIVVEAIKTQLQQWIDYPDLKNSIG